MNTPDTLTAQFNNDDLGLAIQLLCYWTDLSHRSAAHLISDLHGQKNMSPSKFSCLLHGKQGKKFAFDEIGVLCAATNVDPDDVACLADTIHVLGIPNNKEGFEKALKCFPN